MNGDGVPAGPLDWPGLVEEALRRRRDGGLTQKEHAAQAGVSVPTMIAFDRKETSLSLAKAMDILRVVGLVAAHTPLSPQDSFVVAAVRRWEELVGALPPDSPFRQPHGHMAFDYEIAGASAPSRAALLEALQQADRKYTGWPPFRVPTREPVKPYPIDGGVECWLGRDAERADRDAAHSDFWRATLEPRLYLRRGYQEDAADVLPPATVFDLTLPIWRTGETLLHALHLAEAIGAGPDAEMFFRVRFTGLTGRELKSWANPNRDLFGAFRCRTAGDGVGSVACRAGDVEARLPDLVASLLAPVYELFSFFQLPRELVSVELDRLRTARQSGRAAAGHR